MDITEKKKKHLRLIVAAVSTVAICHMNNKYVVDGRLPNSHDADYDKVVEKISKMKEQKQLLFTRMYRLSPMSFDKVLVIIELLSFQTYCCSRTWSSLFWYRYQQQKRWMETLPLLTCKAYYAYGLQAFCDSQYHFVMISLKLCLSTNDNTTYIVTQLSKDIKAGNYCISIM
jgi:hypothetical protein